MLIVAAVAAIIGAVVWRAARAAGFGQREPARALRRDVDPAWAAGKYTRVAAGYRRLAVLQRQQGTPRLAATSEQLAAHYDGRAAEFGTRVARRRRSG